MGSVRDSRRIDFLLLDAFSLEMALFLGTLTRFGEARSFFSPSWMRLALIAGIINALVMVFGRFLPEIRLRGLLREAIAVTAQLLLTACVLTLYLFATYQSVCYSRLALMLAGIYYCVISWAVRQRWKRVLLRIMTARPVRCVLIGDGSQASGFAEYLEEHPILHTEVVGTLGGVNAERLPNYRGTVDRLEGILQSKSADRVVLCDDGSADPGYVIGLCEKYGVRFSLIPSFSGQMASSATLESLGRIKLLNFRETPLDNAENALLKRVFDVLFSVFALILASPVMLFVAIGVRLSSPGPVLFRQERVGKDRRNFQMLKFRSMKVTSTENTGWTTDDDPRKTPFGSFIRKYSLDELPQLWNVLRGEMSIVGPRPEIPFHVEHFMNEIPMYLVRQRVRPGLTGWAQVNGLRGDTDISARIEHDLWYIEHWQPSLDLKIIIFTVFGGMVNRERVIK